MGARVPDGYFNQTYMVEFEVPGALDGTTPSPDIDFAEGNDDPQQIFRPEVENDLGLIDVDYLVSSISGDNEGARGNRWVGIFWLDASVAGDPGAALEVVDAVTGAPVTQESIAALGGLTRFYRRSGILVPQGSLLRISGFAAGPTPHRIRIHISQLTDDGLLFAQNVMCCFESAGGAVETWQQVLQNGPASGGEDALMTGGSQFRLQAGSDVNFEIGAGGSGGMNWDNGTNPQQAAIDYDDSTSLMAFRVSNADEMQLSATALSPVLTGGLDIGGASTRWGSGFINALLVAGALVGGADPGADDIIAGDHSGDVGFTLNMGTNEGELAWNNGTNNRQAALTYVNSASRMDFRVGNVDELSLDNAVLGPTTVGGLNLGTVAVPFGTVFAQAFDLSVASPTFTLGDGTGTPTLLLQKGPADSGIIQWRSGTIDAVNDRRLIQDSSENMVFDRVTSVGPTVWTTDITIDTSGDVTFANDVSVAALLVAGAAVTDGVTGSNNVIVGDGVATNSYGETLFVGGNAGDLGRIDITAVAATQDGWWSYEPNTNTHEWGLAGVADMTLSATALTLSSGLDLNSASPVVTVGDGTGSPDLVIDKLAAGVGEFYFRTGGASDWAIQNATTEDLVFNRFIAGVFQDSTFIIRNATGNAELIADLTLNSASPTATFGDGTGSPSQTADKSDAGTHLRRLQVGGVNRWIEAFDANEDYNIDRYNAAGVFQDNAFVLAAATGDATFANDLALNNAASPILSVGASGGSTSPSLHLRKTDVSFADLVWDVGTQRRTTIRLSSSEDLQIFTWSAADVQNSLTTLSNADGTWTMPANLTLNSASPDATFGDGTGGPQLFLDKAIASSSEIQLTSVGNRNWIIQNEATTEDFRIIRYIADVFQDVPLLIDNPTGNATFGQGVILGSGSPTLTVGNGTGSPTVTLDKLGTATSQINLSSAGNRDWAILDNALEAFVVARYVADVFQDSPLSIDNAAGNVTLANDLTLNSANPVLGMGDGSGAPQIRLSKGAGVEATVEFVQGLGTDTLGDFRIAFDSGENWRFQRFNVSWEEVFTLGSDKNATVYNNLQVGHLTAGTVSPVFTLGTGGGNATMALDALATLQGIIQFEEAGTVIWDIRKLVGADGDFRIGRFTTAGGFQDEPFVIDNATGDITLANDLTLNSASPVYTMGNLGGSPELRLEKDNAGTATINFVTDSGLGSGRWTILYDTSENWLLQRRNNVGTFLDNAIIVRPNAGEVELINDLTLNSASPVLEVGNAAGTPNIVLNKDNTGVGDLVYRSESTNQWIWRNDASENLTLRRYVAAVYQDDAITVTQSTGDVTLANQLRLVSTNPLINMGDFSGSPTLRMDKTAAGSSAIQMFVTSTATANAKRILHDTDETMEFANFNGATWDAAMVIDNNADVNITNQLLVAGAAAANAVSTESNMVIGDGSAADHGITIFTGQDGGINVTNGSGTTDGRAYYDTTSHSWFFETAGAIQGARIAGSGVLPRNDGGESLGTVASLGWDSMALKERADHVGTPTASRAEFWLLDQAATNVNTGVMTDGAGNDRYYTRMETVGFKPEDATIDSSPAFRSSSFDMSQLNFDGAGATEQVFWAFTIPWNYGGQDIIFRIQYTIPNTNSGSVVWQIQIALLADSTDLTTLAFDTAVTVTDNPGGVADTLHQADIAVASTDLDGAVAGSRVYLRLFRDSAHGSDTYGSDAQYRHGTLMEI